MAYHQFPTHAPISKNRFIKINGQSLYNGKLHFHARSTAVDWIHDYLGDHMGFRINNLQGMKFMYPIHIQLDFHVPLNYGTIRMIKGRVIWKPVKEDYCPNWDIDNQWIWNKLFIDVLQIKGIIPNDNIKYVNTAGIRYIPVEDIDSRQLVYRIKCLIIYNQ